MSYDPVAIRYRCLHNAIVGIANKGGQERLKRERDPQFLAGFVHPFLYGRDGGILFGDATHGDTGVERPLQVGRDIGVDLMPLSLMPDFCFCFHFCFGGIVQCPRP